MLAAIVTILMLHCSALQLRSPNETSPESARNDESSLSGGFQGRVLTNALDSLWQGKDSLSIEEWSTLKAYIKDISIDREFQLPMDNGVPKLQILGMFDSGTNLMGALVAANMNPSSFSAACSGTDGYSCHFWKHSPPNIVPALLESRLGFGHQKGVVVAMVRSPLSHILGWELAPYDLAKSCLQDRSLPMAEQEAKACVIDNSPDDTVTQISEQSFQGLTGLWNSYVNFYDHLKQAYPGSDVFVVEYEKLVLNPEPIVREIVAALEFQPPQPLPFVSVEEPAKTHGHKMTRNDAIRKIKYRSYLNQYPLNYQNDQMLCAHLDKQIMERHAIPFDGGSARYSSDCSADIERAPYSQR